MLSLGNSNVLDSWFTPFRDSNSWLTHFHLIELFRCYWFYNNEAARDIKQEEPLFADSIYYQEVMSKIDFQELDPFMKKIHVCVMAEANVDLSEVAMLLPLNNGDYLLLRFPDNLDVEKMDSIRDEILQKLMLCIDVHTINHSLSSSWERGELYG